MNRTLDEMAHGWFRLPYRLHVHRKRRAKRDGTTYLFLHGLGDTAVLWDLMVADLPKKDGYITLDLLGFGRSPVATWSAYDAQFQARSVRLTCRLLGIAGPVVVVGHSLGGLVAVEITRHYPRFVSRMILCSPPLYETSDDQNKAQESLLRRFYEQISKTPKFIVDTYALGQKIGFAPASLNVSLANVDNFIASLQSAIINQRIIPELEKVSKPVTIIGGVFDPLIIHSVYTKLARKGKNITVVTIPAGHIINQLYRKTILKSL